MGEGRGEGNKMHASLNRGTIWTSIRILDRLGKPAPHN